jgi:holo-[acyl-carrier protein] synthase
MRIGVDMVSIVRIAHSLSVSSTFASSVFAPSELKHAGQMPEHRAHEFLAGRFAAKEAVLKALQVGNEDPASMKSIETISGVDGCPSLRLTGSVAQIAFDYGLSHWQVSISHDAGLALAFVLLS